VWWPQRAPHIPNGIWRPAPLTCTAQWPPSWNLWVAVQVTTCRGRRHTVVAAIQAAQLVVISIHQWLFHHCSLTVRSALYSITWWKFEYLLKSVILTLQIVSFTIKLLVYLGVDPSFHKEQNNRSYQTRVA